MHLLKSLNLIIISGETRNRIISCNEPENILKFAETATLEKRVKHNLSALRATKWLIEYLEDIPLKERISDLQLYLRTVKPDISFGDKVILEEKGDIERAATFNPEDFMDFIFNQKSRALQQEHIFARAGEYDNSHKSTFKEDLKRFYSNNQSILGLDAYKHRRYTKLIDCPYELQKLFLKWVEPGLF